MTKRSITFLILAFATTAFASQPSYPKLFFHYSHLYDEICATNNPVTPSWAEEAQSRENEFAALWEKEAPTLMGQLFKDFGKGFSRKELTATLSVCHGGGSFSAPLVLDVTWYLKTYMGAKPLRPDYAFVDLVFHELLHTWVDENLKYPSPLLIKYRDESPSVRAHLHLMAVQKLIYIELGRTDMLNWINWLYPRMVGAYPRAWQIVNKEGYEAFVAELKRP